MSHRTRAFFVALFTAAVLFVIGYGVIRNEARIDQNERIIKNQTDLLTEIRGQAVRADAAREAADTALLRQLAKLLKITTDVQETVETREGVRIITRTITRNRTVVICRLPNGRPC